MKIIPDMDGMHYTKVVFAMEINKGSLPTFCDNFCLMLYCWLSWFCAFFIAHFLLTCCTLLVGEQCGGVMCFMVSVFLRHALIDLFTGLVCGKVRKGENGGQKEIP